MHVALADCEYIYFCFLISQSGNRLLCNMNTSSNHLLHEILKLFTNIVEALRFHSINIQVLASLFLSASSTISYATRSIVSTLQMHIISIIICSAFPVFVKVVSPSERRTVGQTREILIINSMKLWQIEIKLQSNRFSRAIVRSRWARCFTRAHSFARTCMYVIRRDQYPGDITLVISKRNCERGRIGEFGFYVTMDW